MALVNGAKYSVVANFDTGELYRPNPSARRIIMLGERGFRVAEAAEILELETMDLLRFIEQLAGQGYLQLSSEPKPEKIKVPLAQELKFIWLEVTCRCNLHCIHCYADAGQNQGSDPSAEEIYGWLDEASMLGCKKVQFTGGECTMREDLDALIGHARKKGYDFIEVFTNGTLITEPLARFFAKNGTSVALSLYSYRSSTHDSITGVPGSFEKTISGLKLLLASGVSVRCAVIAMRQNEDDLDTTQRLLKDMGIFSKAPTLIRPIGRGNDTKNWPKKIGQQSIKIGPNFLIDREVYELSLSMNNCWSGQITITNNGNVLPCIFARDQVAGNVRSQALSEIIEGKMKEFWGLNMDYVEICKDCEYRYFCPDCRPWAYGYSGNLCAKSPICTYDPYTGKWGTAEEALHLDNMT
jgi:radical SAM protein with 4Fe4S-binding SPASM domain